MKDASRIIRGEDITRIDCERSAKDLSRSLTLVLADGTSVKLDQEALCEAADAMKAADNMLVERMVNATPGSPEYNALWAAYEGHCEKCPECGPAYKDHLKSCRDCRNRKMAPVAGDTTTPSTAN